MRHLNDFVSLMRRLNDFVSRQPVWRFYVFLVVIGAAAGIARGHSFERWSGTVLFGLLIIAAGDTVRWFSKRRRASKSPQ